MTVQRKNIFDIFSIRKPRIGTAMAKAYDVFPRFELLSFLLDNYQNTHHTL